MKKNKNIEAKASQAIETANNAEVLNQEVAQAIANENATEVESTSTKKEKKSKKAKKAATKESEVKAEGKKDKKKKKASKKAKAAEATAKEVAKQQKVALVEKVVANREVKYIYPEDVTDTLSRKTWRQKTRNKLHQLELAVGRIKDQNSKEYKKALKEYNDFKKQVLKPEQVA
jgi:hypothetical protein|nr:MAG TPA: hypothetical protein [Caudoviricetes sp.]